MVGQPFGPGHSHGVTALSWSTIPGGPLPAVLETVVQGLALLPQTHSFELGTRWE